MSAKVIGWEGRLTAYIRQCSRASFRPGELDCAMFFAGGVEAMTGVDHVAEWRGNYATIDEGLTALNALGFADHVAFVSSKLPELSSPLAAQRGDCAVLTDDNGFPALGIVQGENIYHMTLSGLALRPLTDATRAFRV